DRAIPRPVSAAQRARVDWRGWRIPVLAVSADGRTLLPGADRPPFLEQRFVFHALHIRQWKGRSNTGEQDAACLHRGELAQSICNRRMAPYSFADVPQPAATRRQPFHIACRQRANGRYTAVDGVDSR